PVRRRVALKIIKLGMDTRNVIARFEAERQALAMMDHPNICAVLDAGATKTGRPYFVMELVHGLRILEYCDQRRLDTRERLDLFIQVCHAIQHAHQKGIIHRDIKPSNVLVTVQDGVPMAKVIDFGVAKAIAEKLTDKTLFTVFGHFIGTPAYMSPEQADFSSLDVDTRSDIYSLGVLLYELLTGRTPFEQGELLASGLDEMRRTLREREPHRPSAKLGTLQTAELTITAQRRHIEPPRLQSMLRGDLDWIVMKALEKDRNRRYQTANGLAADIHRYLDDEPVIARPPSRWYRLQKLVRRNRAVFVGAAAVAFALVVGLGTATWLFMQEREMRHRAVAAEKTAEQARVKEAELRRQAETRERITQAALLISQGKLAEADGVTAEISFRQPTLEGAAVLRALGEWHACNGRWAAAADRLFQLSQIDQLEDSTTAAMDFLRASAAIAAAGNRRQFEQFRQMLALRYAAGSNPAMAQQILKACLLLPAPTNAVASLQPLAQAVAPMLSVSIGNPRSWNEPTDWAERLKLQNIGTDQPSSLRFAEGSMVMVGGGSDIFGVSDAFAYACVLIRGDFDFRLRVHRVSPRLDQFTRVGLMARESLAPGGRHVMVAVNANQTFQVIVRSAENAYSESLPQNPLPPTYDSNSWVRLQRSGEIFHAYTSSNGLDWTELYATAGRYKHFNDTIYFGIAAGAHSTNAVATNWVSNFGVTPTVSPDVAETTALLDCRRGNLSQAETWCSRLLNYPECNAVQLATARLILALTCVESRQLPRAREELLPVRDLVQRKFAAPMDPGNPADGYWFDWVFARELLRQAEAGINEASSN
ncbi:MAG TPA: protein kinase, partial [Verrucomicrobiae bacterium]|nr:protein kinase [Verrucomicrobiae bacterium]